MRNVIIGSFVGFVLAAAFLAACGGSSSLAPAPQPISTPSALKWTGLGPRVLMASGINLGSSTVWGGTTSVDNGLPGTRNQLAVFDIRASVDLPASASATLEVGVLPAVEAENWSTDPQWIGSITMGGGANRRATLYGTVIPPMPFRLALRTSSSSVRILQVYLQPYNEEFQ